MSNREQRKKLWQEIGLDKSPSSHNHQQQNEINKGMSSLVLSNRSVESKPAYQWMSSSKQSQQELVLDKPLIQQNRNHTDHFQRMMEALNLQVQQIQETEAIQVIPNESNVEQVVDYSIHSQKDPYDLYNEDISKFPESITPLVYSKNSWGIEQGTFRKYKARVSLLKVCIYGVKQSLASIKQDLVRFFKQSTKNQQKMKQEIAHQLIELQQQYQIKLQQALLNQKQEYQQLKYQYQILKGREEITRMPVKSELILQEFEGSQIKIKGAEGSKHLAELLNENIEIKQKLGILQQQRDKMIKQAVQFKKKMAGIQSTTTAIKDSNDKLYEYIFDLEQQIAYHKEEVPKITSALRKQLNDNFSRQIQELEEEKQNILTLQQELQRSVAAITEEKNQISSRLEATQNELTELKIMLQNKSEEVQKLQKLCLSKSQEINVMTQKHEETHSHFKRLIQEKDQVILQQAESLKKVKIDTPVNSRTYQNTSYSRQKPNESTVKDFLDNRQKQDKKILQTLQIQKLVLQKENLHLKAAVEFYNKNYGPSFPGYQPVHSPRQQTSYSIENHYQNTQPEHLITDSNLQLKQRQLLKYQMHLEQQARKLEVKQRQIESDYAIKQSIDQRRRQSALATQRSYKNLINQDDYGMKNVAAVNIRSSNGQQRNQFCSSEAQAIIEKVKKRQRNNEVCCHSRCENAGSCRCDALSRGSRGSRESDSRQYFRTQQYRHQTRSPSIKMDEYFRTDDRNSKMKLIEDKVKRLKSELKTSLSSMKNQ